MKASRNPTRIGGLSIEILLFVFSQFSSLDREFLVEGWMLISVENSMEGQVTILLIVFCKSIKLSKHNTGNFQ